MNNLNLPVISCSLDPSSRSRTLATTSSALLRSQGHHSQVIDLVTQGLPSFDNDLVFASTAFAELHDIITKSDGVVLAFPVYNWAPAASVKSLVEATGATGADGRVSAWFDKVVTFVCAAGLPHSYMATGALAQSLMLDFKCIINPYTAYMSERDWKEAHVLKADRLARLTKTMNVHGELTTPLASRSYVSTWDV